MISVIERAPQSPGPEGSLADVCLLYEQLLQREQDVATYLAVKELKSQEKKADYMVTSFMRPLRHCKHSALS